MTLMTCPYCGAPTPGRPMVRDWGTGTAPPGGRSLAGYRFECVNPMCGHIWYAEGLASQSEADDRSVQT
jgi:hypothetical protein